MSAADSLLLDTHTWLWMAEGDASRFRRKTIERIEAAAKENRLLLAAISLWEVAMLEAKGRIQLELPCSEWLKQAQRTTGAITVPIEADIAARSCALPDFHGDPADRLIVATAIHHGAALLTEDDRIVAYARKGGYRVSRLK